MPLIDFQETRLQAQVIFLLLLNINRGSAGVDAQNDIPLEKIYHTNLTFIQNQNGQKSININNKSKYLQS